ncbi:hypothetical protein [Candidatus Ichthyocystis sparus]|uniref:hypothetical protein n=1 Tax=Candidatus Ichthyocystis sparus TaxID=1561004 RepID=UPI000B828387|nr:hypothetical protein [Candidatus Ichthyocystis sparus]
MSTLPFIGASRSDNSEDLELCTDSSDLGCKDNPVEIVSQSHDDENAIISRSGSFCSIGYDNGNGGGMYGIGYALAQECIKRNARSVQSRIVHPCDRQITQGAMFVALLVAILIFASMIFSLCVFFDSGGIDKFSSKGIVECIAFVGTLSGIAFSLSVLAFLAYEEGKYAVNLHILPGTT